MRERTCDAVVVGAGLAGLWAAIHLPDAWGVFVLDEGSAGGGSSPWAQGGMAVAVGPDDSPERHAADTMRAGDGACDPAAVEVLAAEAPAALESLIAVGCRFDRTSDAALDLNREGGQSVPRSVHAADATGREIMRAVGERAREPVRPVQGVARRVVVVRGRCVGVVAVDGEGPFLVRARTTLLATGGLGALYEATTNPPTATGDGVAMAVLAGAQVRDLEFVQFHPTALAGADHRRVLLTEALRGEGARVVDAEGRPFLDDLHPDADLAPRDLVARAIADRGEAFLDATSLGAEAVARRFPNVASAVSRAGFDLARERVPIAPAAHYALGGVATDTWGRTSVPGLYAAGECAATGAHGANRMAGNSLAEAVVFGRRAAVAMAREAADALLAVPEPPALDDGGRDDEGWERLRRAMTRGAGLRRDEGSLVLAQAAAEEVRATTPDPRLRLAALTASLVCRAARLRRESRGVHFRDDHPERDPVWDDAHLRFSAGTWEGHG